MIIVTMVSGILDIFFFQSIWIWTLVASKAIFFIVRFILYIQIPFSSVFEFDVSPYEKKEATKHLSMHFFFYFFFISIEIKLALKARNGKELQPNYYYYHSMVWYMLLTVNDISTTTKKYLFFDTFASILASLTI